MIIAGGDRMMPKNIWRKQWGHLEVTAVPEPNVDMRLAEVFYALGLIWMWSAAPTPAYFSRDQGFKERIYHVSRQQEGQRKKALGFSQTKKQWFRLGRENYLMTFSTMGWGRDDEDGKRYRS
ncbi:MAG: hypothetical protein Q9168_005838 [Polycauliona sp. 1 TL-2023]